jgi:hypothetical protein
VPNGLNTIYKYERAFIIRNLLQLDVILEESEDNAKRLIAKKKEEEELKLQLLLKQEKEDKIARNKEQVQNSKDYHYYRKCKSNKYIKEAIYNTLGYPEYVSYSLKQNEHLGYLRKIHIYRLYSSLETEPQLEIQYSVLGNYKNKEYSFFQSDVELLKKTGQNNTGIKRLVLRQKPKQPLRLIAIRNEIVKGYLHSLNDYALYSYNEKEKIEKKEYFIFNQNVTEAVFNQLTDYFSTFGHVDIENNEAKRILENIYTEDKYSHDFIECIMQNYLPEEKLENYYKQSDEILPFANEKLYE